MDEQRYRFYLINHHGLAAVTHDPKTAERWAISIAVITGRQVYLHDRMTELEVLQCGCPGWAPHDPADSRYHPVRREQFFRAPVSR